MNRSFRAVLFLLTALVAVSGVPRAVSAAPIDRMRYDEFPELEGRPVVQVLILGNQHTREFIFRREMRITEGAIFRAEDLWRDWERIVDLGLFAHVEVDAVESGDGVLVVISVFERPRWLATPIADYSFDTGKLTFGYRLRGRNLGGANRSLSSTGRAGDKDRVSISWSTPWIGERRQSLSVSLRVELPQSDIDEIRSNSVSVSTTRFLGDYKQARLGVTFFSQLERLTRDRTFPSGGLNELSPTVGVGISRDKRNVRIDPTRGTLASAGTSYSNSWITGDVSFLRSIVDARAYRSVGWGIVLAARANTILTTGQVPDYRDLAVGGSGSIRGQPTEVERGTNIGRVSAEMRFPILDQRRFSLPIPFVPRRVSNVDIRVAGVVFADVGSAWNSRDDLDQRRLHQGFGVGLRVFLPIVELVRLELAFDPSGNPTFYLRDGNVI